MTEGLCASVHNFAPVRSIYRWQGAVHERVEGRASLHTRTELVQEIVRRVKAEHPYEIPSISARPIIAGNPDYLQWMLDETSKPRDSRVDEHQAVGRFDLDRQVVDELHCLDRSGLIVSFVQRLQEGRHDVAIDINEFDGKYGLEYENIQVGTHPVRLAFANGRPPSADSKEYNLITGNPLLCPLDSGEWALVTSKRTTLFKANNAADAAAQAKGILIDNK